MISPFQASTGINILCHILILFVFLTVFFFSFISKTEKKLIRNELNDIIEDEIPIVMKNIDDIGGAYIQWKKVNDMATKVKSRYNPKVDKDNRKLFKKSIIICIVLLIVIILSIVYFKFYKKYDLGLSKILVETMVISCLVGLIEVLFFLHIRLKYVSVARSDLVSELVDRSEYQLYKQLS